MSKPAAIAVFLGLVALIWASGVKTPHHAYRLTVSVDTPQGVKSGSSVVHVFMDTRPGLLPNTGGGSAIWGDAIFLDLGDGKNVVALLLRDDIVLQAFGSPRQMLMPDKVKTLTGKVELNLDLLPTLVTFTDLNDPASAKVVLGRRQLNVPIPNSAGNTRTETIYINEFKTVLGPGHGFRSATIEIVPAGFWPLNLVGLWGTPVTKEIEARLMWMDDPNVIDNPGWMRLPEIARNTIQGLRKPYR